LGWFGHPQWPNLNFYFLALGGGPKGTMKLFRQIKSF
jgi:hypothetical protein